MAYFAPPLTDGVGHHRISTFDSMYAHSMTVREIHGHLENSTGIKVSSELVLAITDAILEEAVEWQNRPLNAVYPQVFFEAIRVKIIWF